MAEDGYHKDGEFSQKRASKDSKKSENGNNKKKEIRKWDMINILRTKKEPYAGRFLYSEETFLKLPIFGYWLKKEKS